MRPSPPAPSDPHLQAVLDVARSVASTLDLDELLERIMATVTRMCSAERSTLFLVDADTGDLWARVAQGAGTSDIHLPRGAGIAGWVAEHGQAVILADAYADPRFYRGWDDETGFRTRSLMCVPFRNASGRIVGVMQCLNKPDGFAEADRDLLETVGGQCAVAIENATLVRRLEQRNRDLARAEAQLRLANEELQILVDLERAIGLARDEGSVLHQALVLLCDMFGSGGATALVVGEACHVVSVQDGQLRVKRIGEEWAKALLDRFEAPLLSGTTDGAPHLVSAPIEVAGQRIGALQLAHRTEVQGGGVRVLGLVASRVGQAIAAIRENAQHDRQERLSLVGQMMSGILHDLRTPISAVSGYAELMAEEQDPLERAYYVGRVRSALELMEEMTQEILQFARGDREIVLSGVDLQRFVASAVEVVRPELDRFGTLLHVEGDVSGPARFDAGKLRRVIANLARNAGQAGARTLWWRIGRADESLWFELVDDGPGIPDELKGRLFQPFATFGKQGGTGLGLAMARLTVEAHGGAIAVESEPGRGTTFRITLPVEPLQGTPLP